MMLLILLQIKFIFGANTERDVCQLKLSRSERLFAIYDWDLILAQYSSTAGGYIQKVIKMRFSETLHKRISGET